MTDSQYGASITERFRHPRHRGTVSNPDAQAEAFNPLCGDRIRVELKISNGMVTAMRYRGDACAICLASADFLVELVEGRSSARSLDILAEDVRARLGADIRPSRMQCVALPLTALRQAIEGLP
jgi:nitrogen fixation NifU-like protein